MRLKRALDELNERLGQIEALLQNFSPQAQAQASQDECESVDEFPPLGHGRGQCEDCGGFHPELKV